nr:hypothetical protein RSP673_12555 [Ralstonia solanacearum P673]
MVSIVTGHPATCCTRWAGAGASTHNHSANPD